MSSATEKNNTSSLKGCFFHGEKMEHKVFTQPKKRQSFNIMRENAIIEDLTPKLPEALCILHPAGSARLPLSFGLPVRRA